jgi:CMP-N-acetylneuraminic acid synthetase
MGLTAFIFARGGSKGLPGKNIRLLAGKPLIAWSIHAALASRHIDRVIVSTDAQDIANVARAHGAEVPFLRPAELAQDKSPEMLAWQHALNFVQARDGKLPDPFISVPTTAPLRATVDIDTCIETYLAGQADMVLTVTDAHRSPWFNMVKRRADGSFGLVNTDADGQRIARRQDAPEVFDITTCWPIMICFQGAPWPRMSRWNERLISTPCSILNWPNF